MGKYGEGAISPYERQNHREAVTYLKAAYRCLAKERRVKYLVIVLSFFVCLCGIFNKYLPNFFYGYPGIVALQANISIYINLASGIILIISILASFYTHRMHVEGINLQERFDCYIYDAPMNQSVMRPIASTIIDVYASKIKRGPERFLNIYYSSDEDYDPDTAWFDNINKQFHSDYRLYLSVQAFFMVVWTGFCLAVFALAISFNDNFVSTLINILFPSLSAINIIAGSWFAYRQQIKQMTAAITVIDGIMLKADADRKKLMTDEFTLRMLQDALFNFRLSPFVIPNFLIRRYEKQLARESWGYLERRSTDLIANIGNKKTAQIAKKKTERRAATALQKQGALLPAEVKTRPLPPVRTEKVKTVYLTKVKGEDIKSAAETIRNLPAAEQNQVETKRVTPGKKSGGRPANESACAKNESVKRAAGPSAAKKSQK